MLTRNAFNMTFFAEPGGLFIRLINSWSRSRDFLNCWVWNQGTVQCQEVCHQYCQSAAAASRCCMRGPNSGGDSDQTFLPTPNFDPHEIRVVHSTSCNYSDS